MIIHLHPFNPLSPSDYNKCTNLLFFLCTERTVDRQFIFHMINKILKTYFLHAFISIIRYDWKHTFCKMNNIEIPKKRCKTPNKNSKNGILPICYQNSKWSKKAYLCLDNSKNFVNIFIAKVFKKLQIHHHKLLSCLSLRTVKKSQQYPTRMTIRFIRYIQRITVCISMYSKESFSAKKYNLKKWMSS